MRALFERFDADQQGVLGAAQYREFLREVGMWGQKAYYRDAAWAGRWPTERAVLCPAAASAAEGGQGGEGEAPGFQGVSLAGFAKLYSAEIWGEEGLQQDHERVFGVAELAPSARRGEWTALTQSGKSVPVPVGFNELLSGLTEEITSLRVEVAEAKLAAAEATLSAAASHADLWKGAAGVTAAGGPGATASSEHSLLQMHHDELVSVADALADEVTRLHNTGGSGAASPPAAGAGEGEGEAGAGAAAAPAAVVHRETPTLQRIRAQPVTDPSAMALTPLKGPHRALDSALADASAEPESGAEEPLQMGAAETQTQTQSALSPTTQAVAEVLSEVAGSVAFRQAHDLLGHDIYAGHRFDDPAIAHIFDDADEERLGIFSNAPGDESLLGSPLGSPARVSGLAAAAEAKQYLELSISGKKPARPSLPAAAAGKRSKPSGVPRSRPSVRNIDIEDEAAEVAPKLGDALRNPPAFNPMEKQPKPAQPEPEPEPEPKPVPELIGFEPIADSEPLPRSSQLNQSSSDDAEREAKRVEQQEEQARREAEARSRKQELRQKLAAAALSEKVEEKEAVRRDAVWEVIRLALVAIRWKKFTARKRAQRRESEQRRLRSEAEMLAAEAERVRAESAAERQQNLAREDKWRQQVSASMGGQVVPTELFVVVPEDAAAVWRTLVFKELGSAEADRIGVHADLFHAAEAAALGEQLSPAKRKASGKEAAYARKSHYVVVPISSSSEQDEAAVLLHGDQQSSESESEAAAFDDEGTFRPKPRSNREVAAAALSGSEIVRAAAETEATRRRLVNGLRLRAVSQLQAVPLTAERSAAALDDLRKAEEFARRLAHHSALLPEVLTDMAVACHAGGDTAAAWAYACEAERQCNAMSAAAAVRCAAHAQSAALLGSAGAHEKACEKGRLALKWAQKAVAIRQARAIQAQGAMLSSSAAAAAGGRGLAVGVGLQLAILRNLAASFEGLAEHESAAAALHAAAEAAEGGGGDDEVLQGLSRTLRLEAQWQEAAAGIPTVSLELCASFSMGNGDAPVSVPASSSTMRGADDEDDFVSWDELGEPGAEDSSASLGAEYDTLTAGLAAPRSVPLFGGEELSMAQRPSAGGGGAGRRDVRSAGDAIRSSSSSSSSSSKLTPRRKRRSVGTTAAARKQTADSKQLQQQRRQPRGDPAWGKSHGAGSAAYHLVRPPR